MASNLSFPLTNSRGLGKVVFFNGLKFPIVVTPSIMGEPMITAQPFYFLDRLESEAKWRFPSGQDVPSEREIEYVTDNYLYEYSKKHPDSKLTSKTFECIYWRDDPDDHYFHYDWRDTRCLVLDTLNDPSIVECSYQDHPNKGHVYDWCLIRPYCEEALEEYREKLRRAMEISVFVKTDRHPSLGTGETTLPIIVVDGGLLTLDQVKMFEVVEPDAPNPNSPFYRVHRGMPSESNFSILQEVIQTSKYFDEQLLAYYFSAVRDTSPVSQFKNYYNVLEYFFEEAPKLLGIAAPTERLQVESVLRWAVAPLDLLNRILSLPVQTLSRITQPRNTSSGEVVAGVNLSAPDLILEFAVHIYALRNACIHSKKTRKGAATPRIAPSTAEEEILSDEMPIIRWLSTQCIEK